MDNLRSNGEISALSVVRGQLIDLPPAQAIALGLPTGKPYHAALAYLEATEFRSVLADRENQILLPNRTIRYAKCHVMCHAQAPFGIVSSDHGNARFGLTI